MDVIAGIAAAWDAEEMTLRALLDHGRVHDIAMLIACAKSLGIDDAPDMLIVCAQLRLSFISIANEEKLSIQNIF